MNETTVTVVGNVASDVTMRRVGADEHRVVNFRVVSSERRWDKTTETWVDGDRFSTSVSCWRRLAEGVAGSLVKGDPVVVSGRLSVREYEVNGERRYITEVTATAVGPDLSRSSATVTRRRLATVENGVEQGEREVTDSGSAPREELLAVTAGAQSGTLGEELEDAESEMEHELSATA